MVLVVFAVVDAGVVVVVVAFSVPTMVHSLFSCWFVGC